MATQQKVLRRLSTEWQEVDLIIGAKTFKERNKRCKKLYGLVKTGKVEHRIIGAGSNTQGEYRLRPENGEKEKE